MLNKLKRQDYVLLVRTNMSITLQVISPNVCYTGRDDTGTRMEILELSPLVHPYFVATQYHPEYISRPLKPSPPYLGLVLAAAGKLQTYFNNAMSSNTTSEDGENSGRDARIV
jgi:CTP synthase